jgi:hypothetical protein
MSVSIMQLWLPILLSGIFCWFASALIHMIIKYHNADYKKLSNEEQVADAIRDGNTAAGFYHMPHCTDMKEMQNEAMQEKFKKGPIAMISVFENGLPPMGKLLSQQFIYFLVACVLIAYVATLSLMASADFMIVFRLVMVISFLTFGYGLIPYSIWFGHPWAISIRYLIDAIIYGAVVAATFAWLWPSIAG